jgi:hypothetical protein
MRTRIERLRTTALTQTKRAGVNIIVDLHVLRPGLFGWLCGAFNINYPIPKSWLPEIFNDTGTMLGFRIQD